jgi:hypothetical protein
VNLPVPLADYGGKCLSFSLPLLGLINLQSLSIIILSHFEFFKRLIYLYRSDIFWNFVFTHIWISISPHTTLDWTNEPHLSPSGNAWSADRMKGTTTQSNIRGCGCVCVCLHGFQPSAEKSFLAYQALGS